MPSGRMIDAATGEVAAIVIDLQDGRNFGECFMCRRVRRLDHAVGYYCEPTHDPIGSVTTQYSDGGIVGGMCVCKECHDRFYSEAAA